MHHPYVIVGAGPAGLQLSYFLKRAGLGHALLDRGAAPGAFFQTFPRHRKLISINKKHTGTDDPELRMRWDWNSLLADDSYRFSDVTPRYFPAADDFVAYLAEFRRRHELPFEGGFDVASITRDGADEPFGILARDGRTVLGDRLVVATGMSKDWVPSFPGVELCEPYGSVSVQPEDFTDQRVLILGKGNSAFETADNLIETAALIHVLSPQPLRLAWQTHFVGHLRACNNNLLDTYQLKLQNAVLDAEVREIRREGNQFAVTLAYTHAHSEVETLLYDRVITCTGFRFDPSIFGAGCQPELRPCGRLPAMTSEWESKNIPGLFFAGTIMQYRDYKKYMSAFIHGYRYNVQTLSRMLEQRYHGTPWPARAVARGAPELMEALLARANKSSALWQQPGFLCDALQLDTSPSSAEYYEDLPVDYVRESRLGSGRWLMLTLEFGVVTGDPFSIDRVHRTDATRASESVFLHPIVRYYRDGQLVAEHHVLEDLAAVWDESEHREPLTEFVGEVLSGNVAPGRGAASVRASGLYPADSAEPAVSAREAAR